MTRTAIADAIAERIIGGLNPERVNGKSVVGLDVVRDAIRMAFLKGQAVGRTEALEQAAGGEPMGNLH